jgi:hypothetical protein
MTQDALTIYQDFLDRTAMGLLARDADAFLRLIHLPSGSTPTTGRSSLPT